MPTDSGSTWVGVGFVLGVLVLGVLMPMTPSMPRWDAENPHASQVVPPPGAHPMQVINCELACGCFKRTPEGLTVPE